MRSGYVPPQMRQQASTPQPGPGGTDAELARRRQAERQKRIRGIITAGAPVSEPESTRQPFLQRLGSYFDIGGGYARNVVDDYEKGAKNILSDYQATARGEQDPFSTTLQTVGEVAKAAFSPINNAIKPFIEGASDTLTDQEWFQRFAVSPAGDAITGAIDSGIGKYREIKQKYPLATANTEAAAEIALLLVGEAPAQKALQGSVDSAVNTANRTLRLGTEIVNKANRDLPGLAEKGASLFGKGNKTTEGIVGEITQAPTKDIPAATRAISTVDTTGINNYRDFSTRIKNTVSELANKVDEALGRDSNVYKADDLIVKRTSPGGQEVRTDFVSRALNDLLELYSTTGDDVARTGVEEARVKLDSVGFTRQEVNTLARRYGEEFGEKAFSKMGEPLTSVNAQLYENTRSGLKEVARQGMDDTAKTLDRQIADLYVLDRSVKKNVEKVAQLYNKIQERGVLEQIGNITGKAIDVASGGLVRSFLSRFFPSNVGLKRMNYLDIEAALSGNLKKLDRVLNAKNDSELIKAIREFDAPQFRSPKLEQRSSIERSPLVKYFKENPPNIGLTTKMVGEQRFIPRTNPKITPKPKAIDSLTKDEMLEVVKYIRGRKPYNQYIEEILALLAEKYGLTSRSYKTLANQLERLVEKTKTITKGEK